MRTWGYVTRRATLWAAGAGAVTGLLSGAAVVPGAAVHPAAMRAAVGATALVVREQPVVAEPHETPTPAPAPTDPPVPAPSAAVAARPVVAPPAPVPPRPSAPPAPVAAICGGALADRTLADIAAARRAAGLGALAVDPALCRAAGLHAGQDAQWDQMTHNGLAGDMAAAGSNATSYGEVLGTCSPDASPDFIQQLWMQSSEHHAILMTAGYTRVGAAWARSASGHWYVSAILAA